MADHPCCPLAPTARSCSKISTTLICELLHFFVTAFLANARSTGSPTSIGSEFLSALSTPAVEEHTVSSRSLTTFPTSAARNCSRRSAQRFAPPPAFRQLVARAEVPILLETLEDSVSNSAPRRVTGIVSLAADVVVFHFGHRRDIAAVAGSAKNAC